MLYVIDTQLYTLIYGRHDVSLHFQNPFDFSRDYKIYNRFLLREAIVFFIDKFLFLKLFSYFCAIIFLYD